MADTATPKFISVACAKRGLTTVGYAQSIWKVKGVTPWIFERIAMLYDDVDVLDCERRLCLSATNQFFKQKFPVVVAVRVALYSIVKFVGKK